MRTAIAEKSPLAADIIGWRERIGISTPQAAKIIGVSLPTFQGWQKNRTCPHEKLLRIAMAAIEADFQARERVENGY
ncbi:hypothetical protein MRS76_18605 [Rhizobiaceae bacterium n13]|uniref:Transcriptional regulator n=1 Tax=Ferirhizobium litorale TaxID=2927786 RepID=A0AAE3QKZ3_9HYPH|nr:hypothetical protein [Fererhizobium litorale]MDI7863965.1 hypothetical protein [Fererhizobium litorale]MDI7925251.1 hypothetical protein [Fererhizobium litorale]